MWWSGTPLEEIPPLSLSFSEWRSWPWPYFLKKNTFTRDFLSKPKGLFNLVSMPELLVQTHAEQGFKSCPLIPGGRSWIFSFLKRTEHNKNKLFWKDPRDWIWILAEVTRVRGLESIIWKRPVPPDHLLQKSRSSKWSFANGRSLQMIICKRPDPPDDHLQMAGPSRWSFARDLIVWMIICKWPVQMIICKRPVHPNDHFQEAGQSWWSFARG